HQSGTSEPKDNTTRIVVIVLAVLGGVFLVCGGLAVVGFIQMQKAMTNVNQQFQSMAVSVQKMVDASNTAETIVARISNGQIDEAYKMTSAGFKKKQDPTAFRKQVEKNKTVFQNHSETNVLTEPFHRITFSGPNGTIDVTLI